VISLVTGCALGAALGARHALEPDHLAAVSTLIAERPRPRQAAALGALWGIGHAATLLVVGAALLLARGELPAGVVAAGEAVVAVMLIVLGARSVRLALRGGDGPATAHAHGGRLHVHRGAPRHLHLGEQTLAVRPLLIGLVHGLAGSGGLTALALAEMPTTAGAIGYIVTFGLGSIAGMAAISGLAGASLARVVAGPRARAIAVGAAGALSVIVGLAWGAIAIAAGG
jgi:hypothetical protein